ncbi:hypothetical protein [Kribbella sp. HUAS MG21]|uniref:Aminoglycoside phosphotransferase domain-containing protein n=1 Tax=Kribbella sp. HUAS MG21 TaxID=3160966 RepID=A0AAU7TLT1_9ACTN
MWFKENNPGHRFEAGLVAAMAAVAPEDVVVPIAVDRGRGWLLAEDHGATLSHAEVADQRVRCVVVRALARLQCALLGRLEPGGILEVHPGGAGDRVRGVVRAWAGLAAGHPLRVADDVLKLVESAADVLDRRAGSLSGVVPLDVEINDVYPANIFADRSTGTLRTRFFDFGNAVWGHPFVSLHGFLDSVVEWTCAPLPHADRETLYDVYLKVWSDHLGADPRLLRNDLRTTGALLSVHRLLSWQRLIPYADPLEISARAEIPLKYLSGVAALGR